MIMKVKLVKCLSLTLNIWFFKLILNHYYLSTHLGLAPLSRLPLCSFFHAFIFTQWLLLLSLE